jgi:xanthine dehydrogenase small subunit
MTTPKVNVNGREREIAGIEPYLTALDWLRDQGLTGAKEGCAEGECGACSVLVARPDADDRTRWTALNACLVPILSLDGQELVTAEGLGKPGALHPVQYEMAGRGGSQCGYCTPGFICSMAAEYYRPERTAVTDSSENGHHASTDDHEHGPNGFDLHALSGNLCRCTGYRPIRDAAYALDAPPADDTLARRCDAPAPAAAHTRVRVGATEFVRPVDLPEALALLAERDDALVVAGCTDWGVEVNIRGSRAPFVVAIDRLPELRTCSVRPDSIEIGAALTLSEAERLLEGRVPLLDQVWPQFASRLIRNGATIGGNLGTGSPIGDMPPALLALEASLVLAGPGGDREVPLADYFTGYRQTVKRPDELIRAVRIPLPLARTVGFHKIAKRRFDDISSVAVGFAFDIAPASDGSASDGAAGTVVRAVIGLGGVAATPLRATATEAALAGRPWTADTVREAAAVLGGEGTPLDDHRASAAYRAAMLSQSLLKFHAESDPARRQEVRG